MPSDALERLAAIGSSDSGILHTAQTAAFIAVAREEQRSIEAAAIQRELTQPELLAVALELREAVHILARRRACRSSDRPMRAVSVLYGLDPEISERVASGIESGELESKPGDTPPAEWRETAQVQRALLTLVERICAPLPDGTQPVIDPDVTIPPF